jgi:hypothetical protein
MRVLLVVTFLAFAAGTADATELLVNGGFETGDFTGWILNDPSGSTSVQPTSFGYGAQAGNSYVYAGPPSSSPGSLSQTFADHAGDSLKISGWAIGDTFNSPNNLGNVSYYFDKVFLGSPDLSSGNWTNSLFSVLATGNDTFSILFSNDNSFNGLDTFSVTSPASVTTPLPSTWTMMLIGLVGFGWLAYQRAQQQGDALA